MVLTHGSLFSGIGGFDLGFERAGFKTVWQVEIDPYCQAVLAKHFPDARRFADVRECGAHNLQPVHVLTGGFPCQPFSIAGKRRGESDSRNLWPEMHRIISILKPTWVVGENVPNLGSYLDTVCDELEAIGYEVAPPLVVPALAFGSQSFRFRIFIVALANGKRFDQGSQKSPAPCQAPRHSTGERIWRLRDFRGRSNRVWKAPESCFERVDYGLPGELDRLRSLGNAVVPQIAAHIAQLIMTVEQSHASHKVA